MHFFNNEKSLLHLLHKIIHLLLVGILQLPEGFEILQCPETQAELFPALHTYAVI